MTAEGRIPQEVVDKAVAVDVAALAARYGFAVPIPASGEAVGPCPGCGGTDRFSVNRKKNIWRCRQGGGDPIGGDAVALVRHVENCSFPRAVELLTGGDIPVREHKAPDPKADNEFREKERRRAFQLWREAYPFPDAGFVARYLGYCRRLDPELARMPGAHCREHEDLPYWHPFTSPVMEGRKTRVEWRVIHRGPAMLWPIQAPDGHFLGLHATWIDLDAPKGKAEISHPETGELLPAKKVRGSQKGGRIVLRDVMKRTPGIAVGEGVESVLSWHARRGRDVSLECAVNLGNLAGKAARTIAHPDKKQVRRDDRLVPLRVPGPEPKPDEDQSLLWAPHPGASFLILVGDGDSDAFTTKAAMLRAERRLPSLALDAGDISIDWPPAGHDFNSWWMAER